MLELTEESGTPPNSDKDARIYRLDMRCCLGSTLLYFWKHLDIVRRIEFKNAFPQLRELKKKNWPAISSWFVLVEVIKFDNDPGLGMAKKYTKKRDARTKLLFCSLVQEP